MACNWKRQLAIVPTCTVSAPVIGSSWLDNYKRDVAWVNKAYAVQCQSRISVMIDRSGAYLDSRYTSIRSIITHLKISQLIQPRVGIADIFLRVRTQSVSAIGDLIRLGFMCNGHIWFVVAIPPRMRYTRVYSSEASLNTPPYIQIWDMLWIWDSEYAVHQPDNVRNNVQCIGTTR